MTKKVAKHYLSIELETKEDAVLQVQQLLEEERKAGYIKSFNIQSQRTDWKDESCQHERHDSSSELCPDCEMVVAV